MKLLVALVIIILFLWIFFRPIFDLLGTFFGKIIGIDFKDKREEK